MASVTIVDSNPTHSKRNHVGDLKIAIEMGANLKELDGDNLTPIQQCALRGFVSVARLVLDAGSSGPNATDHSRFYDGATSVHIGRMIHAPLCPLHRAVHGRPPPNPPPQLQRAATPRSSSCWPSAARRSAPKTTSCGRPRTPPCTGTSVRSNGCRTGWCSGSRCWPRCRRWAPTM